MKLAIFLIFFSSQVFAEYGGFTCKSKNVTIDISIPYIGEARYSDAQILAKISQNNGLGVQSAFFLSTVAKTENDDFTGFIFEDEIGKLNLQFTGSKIIDGVLISSADISFISAGFKKTYVESFSNEKFNCVF